MSRIDWQAYDDGSLTPEQMAIADQLLAQAESGDELEGLREFRETLRTAALREPVPTQRLQAMLREVASSSRPKSIWLKPLVWVPTAAAAAVLAIGLFTLLKPGQPAPIHFDDTPVMASMESPDARQGALWLVKSTGHPAPMITMPRLPQAQYIGSKFGKGWMCYQYVYKGKTYSIYCREADSRIDSLACRPEAYKDFYYSDSMVGWHCVADMTYVVTGGDDSGRWDIAHHASHDTPHLVRG